MTGDVLRGPDLAAGVLAVAVLPDVADRHRVRRFAGEHVLAEQAPDDIVIDRQTVLREYGIAELLEFFEDFVIHARVVVIRTAQQDDAQAVFALELFEHFASGAAHGDVIEIFERAIALLDGALILFGAEAEDVLELLEHLALEKLRVRKVHERIHEADALLLEEVTFLGERGLHGSRRGRHGGTRAAGLHMAQRAGEAVDHREKDDVERLLGVDLVQQVVDVRNAELRREARVDGAALRAFLIQFFAGVLAVDDVLGLEAEAREVARENRRLRVHVEHARHADANLGAFLHQRGALLLRGGDLDLRHRVGNQRRVGHAEDALGGDLDEVRVGLLDLVEIALDAAHFLDVFDRALFAGGDDQPLRAGFERHLGFRWRLVVGADDAGLDVDEGAQALVLAEVATRRFVARGLVLDVLAGFETDEGAHAAVVPETSGFERGADRACLAAVLMHDDVGLNVLALEAALDEVDLRLHGGQVVLCAALEQEALADRREVRNLRHVQPDILRQHVAQAGHDFFRLPTLALKVHDIALHEHGAAVAEAGKSVGAERHVGVLFHRHVEALRGGLQEVPVAGAALRVELEILHAAVLEDDDLDVLAADVADHVHIVVEMEAGFGVRDGFDQRGIRADDVFEDVLGVTGSPDAENLQLRALVENLAIELLEHLDGVLDRIALGELVGLGEDGALAVFGEQDGFGGSRSAVDADETFHDVAGLEGSGHELLVAVLLFERGELGIVLGQTDAAAALLLFFLAADVDVPIELLVADVLADVIVFGLAELDAADGREVLSIVGGADQILGRHPLWERCVAFLPNLRNVGLPAVAHALDVAVGTAEQEHHRLQRVAAREHGEILHHDGFEQRRHQLIGRDAHFLQAIDIGFGEHAALAGHGMQLQSLIAHLAELFARDAQLGIDLVDHGAGAAGALIVHRRDFLLAAGFGIFLEDDDLGVLAAKLDHAAAFGIHALHGQRDRVHFLDKLGAEKLGETVAAAARDEHARAGRVEAFDFSFEALAELEDLFGLLGVVPLVIAPEDLVAGGVDDDGFDRGRANVHPDQEVFVHFRDCLRNPHRPSTYCAYEPRP